MGSIIENFSALSEVLLADYAARKTSERDILTSRLLGTLFPTCFHRGMGLLVDLKDRQEGPLDVVVCRDLFPPLGEGMARQFFAEGVALCLQVRNWKKEDLTQFGMMAGQVKALDRKNKLPIYCAVVGFETMPAPQVAEFMKSKAGKSIDGALSIGEHVMIRNSQGWYGNPQKVPFVTAQGSGKSLKSFAYWMVQISQTFLGLPFSLADYQHL